MSNVVLSPAACLILISSLFTVGCSKSDKFYNSPVLVIDNGSATQKILDLERYLTRIDFSIIEEESKIYNDETSSRNSQLIKRYAEMLGSIGVTPEVLLAAAGEETLVPQFLNKVFLGQGKFSDFYALSEVALIARIDGPLVDSVMTVYGPAYFEVKVSHQLKNTSNYKNVTVENGKTAHDIILYKGLECVFFLSPTKTTFENTKLEKQHPLKVLLDAFSPYCTSDGINFELITQLGGKDSIEISKILTLAKFSN